VKGTAKPVWVVVSITYSSSTPSQGVTAPLFCGVRPVNPAPAVIVLQVALAWRASSVRPKTKSLAFEVVMDAVGLEAVPEAVTGEPSNGLFALTPTIAKAPMTWFPAADHVTDIAPLNGVLVSAYHSSSSPVCVVQVPAGQTIDVRLWKVSPVAVTDDTVVVDTEVPVFTMMMSSYPSVVSVPVEIGPAVVPVPVVEPSRARTGL
jgi:hypothetical protein